MDKRKNEINAVLKDFIKKVSKLIKINKIILFGSRARNDYRNTSDVDIIIISRDFENVPYYQRSPNLYLLWDYPGDVEIDIICLTPKEFALKSRQIGVIGEAVKEGIEI